MKIRKFGEGGSISSNSLTLKPGQYTFTVHGNSTWLGKEIGTQIVEISNGKGGVLYVELEGRDECFVNGNPKALIGKIINKSSDPNSDLAKRYRQLPNRTGFYHYVNK